MSGNPPRQQSTRSVPEPPPLAFQPVPLDKVGPEVRDWCRIVSKHGFKVEEVIDRASPPRGRKAFYFGKNEAVHGISVTLAVYSDEETAAYFVSLAPIPADESVLVKEGTVAMVTYSREREALKRDVVSDLKEAGWH